jgi:hypothetical protein
MCVAFLAGCVQAQPPLAASLPPHAMATDATSTIVAVKPHPRTLPAGAHLQGTLALRQKADEDARAKLSTEPGAVAGERPAPQVMRDVQGTTFAAEDRILRLALAWRAGGGTGLLEEAKRRALQLAGWSPMGATRFFVHDQAGRSVAWTLALAYDWLYDRWSDDEKRRLLAAIVPRVEEMLSPSVKGLPTGWAGLDWGRKLDRWPYDSHGAVTLARLAVICTALAGEDPLFDRCYQEVVPRYLARPVPWGLEGGYANGTAYAQWDVLYTHFVVWDLLKNALGVDLWQTPWARGYGRFIAYFLPPGTPSGLFGDETEKRYPDVWATQAKAYAAHLPSPLADWYARNQFGENAAHLALLLSPARDWSAIPGALPAGTPHAVHLEDIGWAAMHSDLGDRARTSVYFKSSPYGSYNHSHADQNAFVLHARGRALAIDSGYYDSYGSPHWKDWYKQTRAHNAITFDGGQGQMHDSMEAKGRITRFEHHADYDLATGDATQAYGGALTRALRSIVYLRPDTVLVYDDLASDTPRTWEWNLHALSKMKEKGPGALEIEQDGVRLCVTMLKAPAGAFTQSDRFTTEPQGNYPAQWHARYTTSGKSRAARFLALLDVGCSGTNMEVLQEDGKLAVRVAGRKVSFDGDQAVVSE